MSALNIYFFFLAMNVIATFFMFYAIEGVTRKQVIVNVICNTLFAAIGVFMPTWLLITLSVLMVMSLSYAVWAIRTYDIITKSNVIEEEFHISDLDENDPLSASILKAWERAQRD